MTTRVDLVNEFYEKFGVDPASIPHTALIMEEAKEVREAFAHLLKEIADFEYVLTGYGIMNGFDEMLLDEVEELCLPVIAIASAMPEELREEAFIRIHQSNLSKLDDSGKPVRDPETGKILKGPNYKAPDLSDLI